MLPTSRLMACSLIGREQPLVADEATGHLIDRHDGSDRNAGLDGFDDLLVVIDVELVPRLHDFEARAHALGFADLGSGFNLESLGLITGSDAAGCVRHNGHDGDGPVAQFRAQFLFDGGEVGVQVKKEPAHARLGSLTGLADRRHSAYIFVFYSLFVQGCRRN